MRLFLPVISLLALVPINALSQTKVSEPIIDMHLHAIAADNNGPPPIYICAPYDYFPAWDPKSGGETYEKSIDKMPPCAKPLRSASTDEELMRKTLAIVESRNVIAVASGPPQIVAKWKEAGGRRILPAIGFNPLAGKPTPEDLRTLVTQGKVVALAEVMTQYMGVAVNDPRMEAYYDLAEKLDIPVGIHMGQDPQGSLISELPHIGCAFPVCCS